MPAASSARAKRAAAADVAALAPRVERAADQPDAVGADQQREAGRSRLEVLVGEHDLGDVHRRRGERDQARGGHQQRDAALGEHRAQAGRGAVIAPAGRAGPDVSAQPRQQHRGDPEGDRVDAEDGLRARTTASSAAASTGPSRKPVSRTALNRPLAAASRSRATQARQQRVGRGPEERGAEPGEQREADHRRRAVDEHQPGERRRADHVGDDRRPEPARAVDQPAQQRPEQHRRQHVGQQHRGRAPGGPDPVVGQHEQRDVARARAERPLQMRGEEPARGPLGLP